VEEGLKFRKREPIIKELLIFTEFGDQFGYIDFRIIFSLSVFRVKIKCHISSYNLSCSSMELIITGKDIMT